ncbi:MAG: M48 family metalloprotease [Acidobacteriota bacterium]
MVSGHIRLFTVSLTIGILCGCALNPATGRRQLSLIGESKEISMGRKSDAEIGRSLGLYQDTSLAAYVQQMGKKLAAHSERPDLPWTFRIVDDSVVNAFALPGGFVYVTRGILAHLGSEAELAAVVGHEIGHVTARHSVNQMSKAKLAGLGLNLGTLVKPGLARFGDLTNTSLGLLFLKFSRDDESQADELGLRYMLRAGYDARPMVEVFDLLDRVSHAGNGSSVPNWLATHPAPLDRKERAQRQIAARGAGATTGKVGTRTYLGHLEGLVFGDDPRHGFFKEGAFYAPDLKFWIVFPPGWKTSNQANQVAAASPDGSGGVLITLAPETTPTAAAERFFADESVHRGASWRQEVHGLPAVSNRFTAGSGSKTVTGRIAFIAHNGRVFRVAGFVSSDKWPTYEAAITFSIASFQRLTDPNILDVEPRRIHLVELQSPTTLARYTHQHPSSIPMDQLVLINHLNPDDPLPAGRLIKRVVGGP